MLTVNPLGFTIGASTINLHVRTMRHGLRLSRFHVLDDELQRRISLVLVHVEFIG